MNKNSSRGMLLTTLAGVQEARLERDFIVGRWKQEKCEKIGRWPDGDRYKPVTELTYISNRMAKRGGPLNFINITTDDQILRFTEKYGPLERPLDPAGSTFRQSLKDWREYQAWVRKNLWSQSSGYKVGMLEGDRIEIDARGSVSGIELCSLKRFLEFCIVSVPRAMRRVCANPECQRYFIAARADKRVCNLAACGKWAQREFKRNWWTENGPKWRARRAKRARRHASKSRPR